MIHFENILKTFCFFLKLPLCESGSILTGARYLYHFEPMSILRSLWTSM